MKHNVASILGWYGVVAVIAAYVMVSFSAVGSGNIWYQFLNLTGALGITYETYTKKDYQPFWLNLVWAGIALVALIKIG